MLFRFEFKISSLRPELFIIYNIPPLSSYNIKDVNKTIDNLMYKLQTLEQNDIQLNLIVACDASLNSFIFKYHENIKSLEVWFIYKTGYYLSNVEFLNIECLAIDFSKCQGRNSEKIYEEMILNHAKILKTLKLNNFILSEGIIMSQFPNLQTLELFQINAEIATAFLAACKSTITNLNIGRWYNMQEFQLSLTKQDYEIPNLSSLAIDGNLKNYIGFISSNAHQLIHLSLINSNFVEVDLLPLMGNLKYLYLKGFRCDGLSILSR